MELLWYDIRQLDEETMARTVAMMDETRRRRVSDIAGEDDRKRTVAGELLARRALAERLGCGEDNVPLRWDDTGKPAADAEGVYVSVSHSGPYAVCAAADVRWAWMWRSSAAPMRSSCGGSAPRPRWPISA